MAGEWTSINLGDVCRKIGSGATPRGGSDVYLESGPYSLIRSQNVYNDGFHHDGLAFIGEAHAAELANVEVLNGDVLLNITGDSVARACQVDPRVLPARVNQHVAIIRPNPDKLDPRFLRYFLVSPEMQVKLLSWAGSGGTRNALTRAMIESFDVSAPEDIDEQRAIARILGTLDDKIELNRRINETLEAMARALFKSWFVDFDPVRAKAEGRDPGLPKPLADLFPARLVDSELGAIPERWKVVPLSDLTTVITKGTTPTQEDVDTAPQDDPPVRYVRVNAIDGDGEILFDKLTTIPESVHLGVLKRSVLRANDVLYTIAGTIGRVSIVGESLLPANTNQAVAVIRPRSTIPSAFLALAMRQEAFREELHSNIVHAVQANLSLGMLSKARVAVPPEGTLPGLFALSDALVGQATLARAQSRTLGALRDTLLPRLISGELRIVCPKAEAEATQ